MIVPLSVHHPIVPSGARYVIVPFTVPVDPGADEGRRLLQEELAKQQYQAAKPTPVDLATQALFGWLKGLLGARGDPAPTVLLVLALVVVVALVVVALLLFGLPRLNRRSGVAGESLFGDADRRSAAKLRAAARAAFAAGDWSLAVLERFRAVARGLDERTLVAVFPGTTATGFARSAAAVLPVERDALVAAAGSFDGVRYAGRPASREEAEAVTALDERVAAAHPTPPAVPVAVA